MTSLRERSAPLASALNPQALVEMQAAHVAQLAAVYRENAILRRLAKANIELETSTLSWMLSQGDEMVVSIDGKLWRLSSAFEHAPHIGADRWFRLLSEVVVHIQHGEIPREVSACDDVECLGCRRDAKERDLYRWPNMPQYMKDALAELKTARAKAAEVEG